MSKFFVPYKVIVGEPYVKIYGEDSRHIRDVLRMKIGESLTICDLSGVDHECVIKSFDKEIVCADIVRSEISDNEPPFEITVYQGLPKSDKMESIIQKCVELGVTKIVPVSCARSIVKLTDKKDIEKKTARWNKIAYEAAKQCNRSIIPSIDTPIAFKEAINQMDKANISFIPWECEDKEGLKSILKNAIILFNQANMVNATENVIDMTGLNFTNSGENILARSKIAFVVGSEGGFDQDETNPALLDIVKPPKPQIAFIVGPEGGFDNSEIQFAKLQDIKTVTLGKRILRTETVAPAILAMILYEAEL